MTNEPDMDIVNQINAALNDVRATLIGIAEKGNVITGNLMAHYQVDLAIGMVNDHRQGINRPWSDRKHQVEEEFS